MIFAASLLAWVSGTAAAEPLVATNLTLAAAVDLAVRDNAELTSLRDRWEAMRERPTQAQALPNPMFTYSGMDTAGGGAWPDTNEKRYMVQQELPGFGKRRLREDIALKDAEVMQRDLDAMTRETVMMVKENYYELFALQQAIAITRSDETVLRRMAKIAETMYATGDRTQQDVLKANSEITMLKRHLLDLDAQENTLKAKLNALLNRRADAPFALTGPPPAVPFGGVSETLFALAAVNRPEVRAAEAQTERYELESKLMSKESQPDYRLGVEYRDIGGSEDMVMFIVGVDLPIWRSKYRAGLREAEKMKRSSQAARQAAEQSSALDVQDSTFKLQTSMRTLALYKTELIPQAQARYKASESGYQTGKVDFMDLLESQRFLLSVRVMAAMEEGNAGMQFARLERAVGVDLKADLNSGEMKP